MFDIGVYNDWNRNIWFDYIYIMKMELISFLLSLASQQIITVDFYQK